MKHKKYPKEKMPTTNKIVVTHMCDKDFNNESLRSMHYISTTKKDTKLLDKLNGLLEELNETYKCMKEKHPGGRVYFEASLRHEIYKLARSSNRLYTKIK